MATTTETRTARRPVAVVVAAGLMFLLAVIWGIAALGTALATVSLVIPPEWPGSLGVLLFGPLTILLALFTRYQFRLGRGLLDLDAPSYGNTIGLLKIYIVLTVLNVGTAFIAGVARQDWKDDGFFSCLIGSIGDTLPALIPVAFYVLVMQFLRSSRPAFGGGSTGSGNLDYIRGKLVQLVAVLLIVTFLSFLLLNLLPGGPETAARAGAADQAALDEFREQYKLNDPIYAQYARWLDSAIDGDLGQSYVHNNEVNETLKNRLPVSLKLMAYAIFIALLVAVPLGILTAYKENTIFDKTVSTVAFGFLSIPNFIAAVLLVYFFSLQLGWFPATVPEDDETLKSLFLPAMSLALGQIAVFMRLLRTDMIATLQEDYIGVARAKGMPTSRILTRHAFRPSSFSLLTVAGITIGNLIGGTVVIEQIFAINGLGRTIVVAIFERDYLILQGAVVVIAVGFVVINFLVDIFYAVLDPRIRHARAIA